MFASIFVRCAEHNPASISGRSFTPTTTRRNFRSVSTPRWTRGAGGRASGSFSSLTRRKCTKGRTSGLPSIRFTRGPWFRWPPIEQTSYIWHGLGTILEPLYSGKVVVLVCKSRRKAEKFRDDGEALERTEISVDRTIPPRRERHRLTGSADCAAERADQLSDDAPQVPHERPCIEARVDHDGQQAPEDAGLSQPPGPGSVSRDCGTPQPAQVAARTNGTSPSRQKWQIFR